MRVLTCLYVFSVYSQGGLLKSLVAQVRVSKPDANGFVPLRQTSVLDLARKRSPLEKMSTLKGTKRRLESDLDALKRSVDGYADIA